MKKTLLIFKRVVFYLISFTGGALTSIIGLIGIAIFAPFGRVHVYHGRLYAVVGKDGGGLEMGCFFFVCKSCADDNYIRSHECGHGLQNCLGGPLFPFVIGLPSAVRYWYRELKYYRKGLEPATDYYAIWFEKQASEGGIHYVESDKI